VTPLTARVRIEGNNLVVEDCDGNIVNYAIPCTCEDNDDSQIPDPPIEAGTTMCQMAYAIENHIWLSLATFQDIMAEWDDGTGSEYDKFVGITRWIANQKLPLSIYNSAYAFWNTYRPEFPSIGNYHEPDGTAYLMSVCACNNSLETYGFVNDAWKGFWSAQLTTLDEIGLDPGTWEMWQSFINLLPIAWIKSWVIDNLGDSIFTAFPDDCSSCEPPGEPQDCFSDHVVWIREWTNIPTPDGWAVNNITQLDTYGDYMEGDNSIPPFYPSAQRIGLGHWTTVPASVTKLDHPAIALIYDPGETICVFRAGMRCRAGQGNSKRLGVYGLVGSSWVQLSFSLYAVDQTGSEAITDSGHINVTNITKIAFLFCAGGGSPSIAGVWINHSQN